MIKTSCVPTYLKDPLRRYSGSLHTHEQERHLQGIPLLLPTSGAWDLAESMSSSFDFLFFLQHILIEWLLGSRLWPLLLYRVPVLKGDTDTRISARTHVYHLSGRAFVIVSLVSIGEWANIRFIQIWINLKRWSSQFSEIHF